MILQGKSWGFKLHSNIDGIELKQSSFEDIARTTTIQNLVNFIMP